MIAYRVFMAQLLVRNLEEELVRDLKARAGLHGVSVEEEHRRILREALRSDAVRESRSFWQVLSEMPDGGEDTLFERDRDLAGRGTDQPLFED
jgi:antitoxin FitA